MKNSIKKDIYGYWKGGWYVRGVSNSGDSAFIEIKQDNSTRSSMEGFKKVWSLKEAEQQAQEKIRAWKDRVISYSSNPKYSQKIENMEVEIRITRL